MSASLYCKNYPVPAVNKKEALRFAFCAQADAEVELLFDSCMREMAPCLSCKVCYAEFPVNLKGNLIDLGFTCVESADLAKNLAGCERIVLFAATVGAAWTGLLQNILAFLPQKLICFKRWVRSVWKVFAMFFVRRLRKMPQNAASPCALALVPAMEILN